MKLSSYFERIGFDGDAKANLETLKQLHYLHTLAIPFENLNPFLGEEVLLDEDSLNNKLIVGGRGGYCFEQNQLFMNVLKEIGFKVKGLGARVLWNQAETLLTRRSHMILAVEVASETYLADVGFGGITLTTPLKLQTGIEQQTTHEIFRIENMENDLKLQAKISGEWKTVYRFDLQEQYLQDYEVANFYLYTHPLSIFKNNLMLGRPFEDGRYAFAKNQLSIYSKSGEVDRKIVSSAKEVKEILKDKFGINISGLRNLDERLESLLKS